MYMYNYIYSEYALMMTMAYQIVNEWVKWTTVNELFIAGMSNYIW